jgi:hypothetical protein
MSHRVADRLIAARRRQFVGRTGERALFQSALAASELPFLVLYVYGPGGVGKTSLLREFIDICAQMNVPSIYLDARNFEPSADAFLNTLRRTLGLHPDEAPEQALAGARHQVVLIDTYESLAPLDDWLRESFLPQLPENVLVVIAGRQPPSPAWRGDPGWQTLVRTLPLRNLSAEEGRTYLIRRGVPADQCDAVLDFTHSHPLALSLVAEMFAQREAVIFQPESAPDIIKTLIEQFVQKVPGPAHRAALEACALVRLTSEALLGEMLALPDTHELFDWLRGLSFVESGQLGIFPHDLARETLATDLRWRHPDWYRELHRRARTYYINHLATGRPDEAQRMLFDLVFLHRDNPAVRPFFEWQENGSLLPDAVRATDHTVLLEMLTRHEGPESARMGAFWLEKQPEAFLVFRNSRQAAMGFIARLALERTTVADEELDPAVRAACDYLRRRAPLRAGERATLFRFWAASDTYQTVSPVQSMVFIQAVQHYLTTPGLAHTFFPCADPSFWAMVLTYADLTRLLEADFVSDGHIFGVYGHDWRAMPPAAWLTLLAEREVGAPPPSAGAGSTTEQVIVLSQSDFAAAVRDALHDFVRPDLLRNNPLRNSRLVLEHVGPAASAAERVAGLQALIKGSADALQSSPRSAKLYRALYHTYFQPAPTQERAAELLDLPFSTYRRHLMAGIAQITEALWLREVGG